MHLKFQTPITASEVSVPWYQHVEDPIETESSTQEEKTTTNDTALAHASVETAVGSSNANGIDTTSNVINAESNDGVPETNKTMGGFSTKISSHINSTNSTALSVGVSSDLVAEYVHSDPQSNKNSTLENNSSSMPCQRTNLPSTCTAAPNGPLPNTNGVKDTQQKPQPLRSVEERGDNYAIALNEGPSPAHTSAKQHQQDNAQKQTSKDTFENEKPRGPDHLHQIDSVNGQAVSPSLTTKESRKRLLPQPDDMLSVNSQGRSDESLAVPTVNADDVVTFATITQFNDASTEHPESCPTGGSWKGYFENIQVSKNWSRTVLNLRSFTFPDVNLYFSLYFATSDSKRPQIKSSIRKLLSLL
jgi:hypothetical protein